MSGGLCLRPLQADQFETVAHITVAPSQEKFAGTVAEAFEAAEKDADFHCIEERGTPVGFFKIDRGYGHRYPFAAPDAVGLRAFIISRERQGKGIGTGAVRLLPGYLPHHYPKASALFLTVNKVNPVALRAYLSGGFTDTGTEWPHGDAGPQHILRMALPSTV